MPSQQQTVNEAGDRHSNTDFKQLGELVVHGIEHLEEGVIAQVGREVTKVGELRIEQDQVAIDA